MKTKSFLAAAAAFALAIAGLSIPSPVFSGKALAQMTDPNGQAAKGKKGTGTAQRRQAEERSCRATGDRSKCGMGNC